MILFIFLLVRVLDIISTYLCSTTGVLAEVIPVSRYLLQFGWPVFIVLNLLLSLVIYKTAEYFDYLLAIKIFIIINIGIVISNFLTYWYIINYV